MTSPGRKPSDTRPRGRFGGQGTILKHSKGLGDLAILLARPNQDVHITELEGIGGRPRPAGPEPLERLRKAVSARMRDAIRKLETVHPLLGRHLANAVQTGIYCRYAPETPTTWFCQTQTRPAQLSER